MLKTNWVRTPSVEKVIKHVKAVTDGAVDVECMSVGGLWRLPVSLEDLQTPAALIACRLEHEALNDSEDHPGLDVPHTGVSP